MLKRIIIIFFLLGLIVGAVYIGGDVLISKVSWKVLAIIGQQAESYGIEVRQPGFRGARVCGPTAVCWDGIQTKFRFHNDKKAGREYKLNAESVLMRFLNFSCALLEIRNMEVDLGTKSADEPNPITGSILKGLSKFTADYFSLIIPFNIFNPAKGFKEVMDDLEAFIKTGKSWKVSDFAGSVEVMLGGSPFKIRAGIIKTVGVSLVLNQQDLKNMSNIFDDGLTDAEVNIIAKNPMDAAKLLRIKEYAETTASQARRRDNTVPVDAYRHVLWSYLLAKEFGERFAMMVTNAHEEDPAANTAAERLQDYRNNLMGFQYARQGVAESKLLDLVQTDPLVIRTAR